MRRRLVEAFRLQAGWCGRLGSPLYERLLSAAATDLEADGPVARLVSTWHGGDPVSEALALRVMGGVHFLVLEGAAPDLAAHYPSAGGSPRFPGAISDFLATVDRHTDRLQPILDRPVQTNEVRRSSVLLAGIAEALVHHPLPVRLHEIGCSAGLNLNLDLYHHHLGAGTTFGPPGSPVQLTSEWIGNAPPLPGRLVITDKTGSDPTPIDPRDTAEANRLLSYIWPDQTERHALMAEAIGVFRTNPPAVITSGAARHLGAIEVTAGYQTIVMQSVMRQYMSDADIADADAALAALGAAATPTAPVAHVTMEPVRDRMELAVTMWPTGERVALGRAHAHGIRVRFDDR